MLTDDFNRADSADLGANWSTIGSGSCRILDNGAYGGSGVVTYDWEVWSANSWNDDQDSQVTLGGSVDRGVIVRAAAGPDGYMAMAHSSVGMRIYRRDNGSFTLLQDIGGTVTAGDEIKLAIAGSTLKYYQNGVQQGTDQSDSTYASGSAGIYATNQGNGVNPEIDDWVGNGEVGGGGQTVPVGQALETDSAFALTALKTRTLGQPADAESAQPLTVHKTRPLGQASQTELALPITVLKTVPLGLATETSTPQPLALQKTRALGLALETNTALAITIPGAAPLAPFTWEAFDCFAPGLAAGQAFAPGFVAGEGFAPGLVAAQRAV